MGNDKEGNNNTPIINNYNNYFYNSRCGDFVQPCGDANLQSGINNSVNRNIECPSAKTNIVILFLRWLIEHWRDIALLLTLCTSLFTGGYVIQNNLSHEDIQLLHDAVTTIQNILNNRGI